MQIGGALRSAAQHHVASAATAIIRSSSSSAPSSAATESRTSRYNRPAPTFVAAGERLQLPLKKRLASQIGAENRLRLIQLEIDLPLGRPQSFCRKSMISRSAGLYRDRSTTSFGCVPVGFSDIGVSARARLLAPKIWNCLVRPERDPDRNHYGISPATSSAASTAVQSYGPLDHRARPEVRFDD